MLFKEKIFLANCDSVRKLNQDELWKRLRVGLVFADGIILSPNTLIDNEYIHQALLDKQIVKYLKEEGHKKLVVRGNNVHEDQSLMNYFDSLPGKYIVSSIAGSPRKSELTNDQEASLRSRIRAMDKLLTDVSAPKETVSLAENSLSSLMVQRVKDDRTLSQEQMMELQSGFGNVVSRSEAYAFADANFPQASARKLKVELIDPCYNLLFVKPKEAFVQDRIRLLEKLPKEILSAGITIKSLRREITLVKYLWKLAVIIKSFGTEELAKVLTEEALGFIEDMLKDRGFEELSRRNWFGLYEILSRKFGVEIK
jgi:hypothetical protein